MITNADLANRGVEPEDLTDRQREVLQLVEAYYRVAQEAPSYGWLGRRLGVSPQRAAKYVELLRRKRWLGDRRLSKSQLSSD
jgi:DNA-binding CsgD family transcriptional regulator